MSPFLCWEKARLHIDLKGSLLVRLSSRRFILMEQLCITPLLWAPSFEHALIMCRKKCVQNSS
jgi:DNA mismatch repair protein MutH